MWKPFLLKLLTFLMLLPWLAMADIQSSDAVETPGEAMASRSLQFRQGEVVIGDDLATLRVPDGFAFLDPQDAQWMLRSWGNPQSNPPLGMVVPRDAVSGRLGGWAVIVDFEEHGYISDEDADKIDYNELLTTMQADVEQHNAERQRSGYATVHLKGWARPPHYDAEEKTLHWAKILQFDNQPDPILNYNIRLLGRRGVLVMNFVAAIDQLPVIERHLNTVLAMASFNPGHRYVDFNPELDKVAAYGLAALVAGKVASKIGLMALALAFLKKFWILPLLVGGWFFRGRRKKKQNNS